MKTIKSIFTLLLLLCFSVQLQAQQMFLVHQDNVKPSKIMEYEKISKEFKEAAVKHNLQTSWFSAMSNDLKYFYITPIENFADLDKKPMADMAKAMGDKFGDMFKQFDKCYDSHGSYIIAQNNELSYMPEDDAQVPQDENYRLWFYIYYTPENKAKIIEGIKAVKALYKTKGSKEYYRIYQNAFGQLENYYLVSVSAKSEVDAAERGKANEKVLGTFEERWAVFSKVMDHAERYEEYRGEMRPDLSYAPKEE